MNSYIQQKSFELKRKSCFTFTIRHPTGTTKTFLQTFQLDCGMSWEAAEEKSSALVGAQEWFYKSKKGRDVVQLVVASAPHLGLWKAESQYKIYRTQTGLQDTQLSLAKIKEEFN
ncbi:hypothetical protein DAPPUDRAFT_113922 [Daphnia pulex]|uniref:SBNO alpha/beta domain-containing protein n=1 Tax=Daphnia pulex TaxID=6669 RepID=E9HGI2_DAPPU|nr:hypothetical protein DAPPUDRAFT_113922 [Daphnia pulex]|eukprot:EFX69160.1 hypothetical protein DAPPUDRAFT_113922 [Daphnia pulex]